MLRYICPVIVAAVPAFFVLSIGRAAQPDSTKHATADEKSKAARSDAEKRLVKEQMEALAGKWEIVSCVDDGKEFNVGGDISLTFKGKDVTQRFVLGKIFLDGVGYSDYQFDLEVGKDPKVIHFASLAHTYTAIYRIKQGSLELCYYSDQDKKKDAPKTFDGKKGSGQTLERYKKVTAKKDTGKKK